MWVPQPWLVALIAGFVVAGCAAKAVDLRPNDIPRGQGAVLGRIQVFKGDSEVTSACYVNLTNEKEEDVGRLSLDRSGWVATPMKEGKTYLSFVSCAVWNGLSYGTRQLHFDVRGKGAVTYFGHVRFDLEDRDMEALATAIGEGVTSVPVGSAAGALASNLGTGLAVGIQASIVDGDNRVTVTDQKDVAARAFKARYGITPRLFASLAAEPAAPPDPTPAVLKRGDLVSTQVQTDGMRLTLLGLVRPDAHWLGFRLTHEVKTPALKTCEKVDLVLDDGPHRFPVAYRATPIGGYVQEGVSVKTDLETFKAMVKSSRVVFDACGRRSTFPKIAAPAAADVLATYESLCQAQAVCGVKPDGASTQSPGKAEESMGEAEHNP
jgi:hypothetical protein